MKNVFIGEKGRKLSLALQLGLLCLLYCQPPTTSPAAKKALSEGEIPVHINFQGYISSSDSVLVEI